MSLFSILLSNDSICVKISKGNMNHKGLMEKQYILKEEVWSMLVKR